VDEQTFLNAGAVRVTSARFVVGAQTYAMSSVNSVKVQKTDITPSLAFPGLMVAVGGIWLLVHLTSSFKDWNGYLWPLGILGVGIWWIWRTETKYQYKLVLTTSSGETPVLVSEKAADILPVEKALTDAIVYRG
jgi:hypothetical protein